jgi:hypothetical protein
VFNFKKTKDRATIDKEYDAFLDDLTGSGIGKRKRKAEDAPYVPPMGVLSKKGTIAPLMLTNGSGKAGAASAHARAVSSGTQVAGGSGPSGMEVRGSYLKNKIQCVVPVHISVMNVWYSCKLMRSVELVVSVIPVLPSPQHPVFFVISPEFIFYAM